MEALRCKGSRDLLPDDMARFRHVEQVFRSSCLSWGYDELRTSTLEYLHLFTSTGTLTPGMLSKVYSFLDWNGWSGERVVLRPDGTIPAARLYVENLVQSGMAKLFYVENMFRFEETGQESRERWQCGAELLGSAEPSADVELVLLALEVMARLGLTDVRLQLSHAGLIRALLRESGLVPAEQSRLFDLIMDGQTGDALAGMMAAKPLMKESLATLFDLRGTTPGFLRNQRLALAQISPRLEPSMDNFITIAQLLTDLGCGYQINLSSGKGFEYYTGILFQFQVGEQRVGGGGRYDDLIPLMSGGDACASGFALDMDQLVRLAAGSPTVTPGVLIHSLDQTVQGQKLSFETAALLRQRGYIADCRPADAEGPAHRWILTIRSQGGKPRFLLSDRTSGKTAELDSAAEILGILQIANATKASPS
ncbi:MAG: ATP phosphoribosyltransferase regulatory subunit [Chloroflexi bacterium]|nr:ATP phosphoribosyltransferase regulatory subunit [Chloroflexota bacterium]